MKVADESGTSYDKVKVRSCNVYREFASNSIHDRHNHTSKIFTNINHLT